MSKLLQCRRIRFGARNDTVHNNNNNNNNNTDLDSSLADGSSHRRTTTNTDRRHHHHRRNIRQDLGGCNPTSRRLNRHHQSEHEEGVIQPQSSSIINSEDFRSIRRWGATENDRLPGVVLLARERLVERLRGVHISQNRQNTRSAISIHQDEFSYDSLPMSSMTRMLPPGLSKHELNSLQIMVFNDGKKETASASRECSICLEGFEDGDELINLACMHMFHSCCLFPWIEVCGACPNCRKDIAVTSDKDAC